MRLFWGLAVVFMMLPMESAQSKSSGSALRNISVANKEINQKKYEQASLRLYRLKKTRLNRDRRDQVTFLLGKALMGMKLYQSAAFQFLDLVKQGRGKFLKESISVFFELADHLHSSSFLDYSIEKAIAYRSPVTRNQGFLFRYGQYLIDKKKFARAVRILKSVRIGNENYSKALFLLALAYAELGKEKHGIVVYRKLLEYHSKDSATSYNKNSARLGLARLYYQSKNWQKAIEYYRQVPKDSELWHDTLLELSWAHFRAGHFREVLGVLSSLHSTYYEDFFLPESVLLRSLVYLSICQEAETEKTLAMFYEVYRPMRVKLSDYMKSTRRYSLFYEDSKKLVQAIRSNQISEELRAKSGIPIPVARTLIHNPAIRRTFKYIQKLSAEEAAWKNQNSTWQSSAIGKETRLLLQSRLTFARKQVGQQIRSHLKTVKRQFAAFFRQYDFIKYEMKSEKKRWARQELKGGSAQKKNRTSTVDRGIARNYFSNKGIEYWPFNGEYWLDEIGNYHYLGNSRCVLAQ